MKLILICDHCFTAACYYGEFMCDYAQGAGILSATKHQLSKLKLESPEYWGDEKLLAVYGTTTPNGNGCPRFHRSMVSK